MLEHQLPETRAPLSEFESIVKEPAVLAPPTADEAEAKLKLWTKYSDADGGILENAIGYQPGEKGWICNQDTSKHGQDPVTHKNYGTEITGAINAAGFVPLKKGNIGGGVSGKDNCRLFTT